MKYSSHKKSLFAIAILAVVSTTSSASADDAVSKFVSGPGTLVYLAAGTMASLWEDGEQGKEHTVRTLDSLITTGIVTEALKAVVKEKRPDSDEDDSFPSQHTSLAFSVATMQASFHPKQAPLWYGGATLIGASRLTLRRHHVQDVVAGAALGYFTSYLELRSKRGLVLRPFLRTTSNTSSRSARNLGLGIAGTF